MRQIYPLLAKLHSYAVTLASDKINDSIIAELEQKNNALLDILENNDAIKILEADQAFHQIILNLAANQYLVEFINELTIHAKRAEIYFFRYSNSHSTSVDGHKEIINALRKRDFEAAALATEKNWLLAFDSLNQLITKELTK